jgi:type III secretory pathway component EscS
VVNGFAMPVRVSINGKEVALTPTTSMQEQTFPEEIKTVYVNRNYYINSEKLPQGLAG